LLAVHAYRRTSILRGGAPLSDATVGHGATANGSGVCPIVQRSHMVL
jgi:hypothetical protein